MVSVYPAPHPVTLSVSGRLRGENSIDCETSDVEEHCFVLRLCDGANDTLLRAPTLQPLSCLVRCVAKSPPGAHITYLVAGLGDVMRWP